MRSSEADSDIDRLEQVNRLKKPVVTRPAITTDLPPKPVIKPAAIKEPELFKPAAEPVPVIPPKPAVKPVERETPKPVFVQAPDIPPKPVIKPAERVPETIREPEIIRPAVEKVETVTEPKDDKKMAWKPKTIAGKILKGAVIGGGTVLGIASGVGAVAGVVGGTGLLAGAASGAGAAVSTLSKIGGGALKVAGGIGKGAVKTLSKVGTGAINLVTGTTAEERKQVQAVKKEAKAAEDKLEQVQRLVRAGASETKALSLVGLSTDQVPQLNGKELPKNNNIMLLGGGLLALFLLPKILRR